ncbi:MFS general substrate transporter [Delitschia confertaspora ATCC 74209]|uniref:MFS general substrate transporter n=1 Tax=Delitschia confertaspora ATCC 74209 TaxID=1513339 RepID=A0A9P4JH17_9PLEO|nr:MFS general substrate transporter [Delitschia confertaspora ATCC 74209]
MSPPSIELAPTSSSVHLPSHSQQPPTSSALAMRPQFPSKHSLSDDHYAEPPQTFSLPPTDTGKDAWMYLAAAFVVEMLVWGFPFAYGLFQEYYSTHEPFKGESNLAVIGTCAMGLMYLSGPLVFGLLQAFPGTKRPALFVGLVIMCLSLGLSSLSQTVTQLIATQGVLYAIGGSLVYHPTLLFMDEWFVKRKGLAFGVMWVRPIANLPVPPKQAGTGLGGVGIPLLLQHLLLTRGFRATLRIWSLALFLSTGPLLYFLKPRVPLSQTTHIRRFDLSFLISRPFLLLQAGNILEALGFFIPSIYLPTYARQVLGVSGSVAALTVILFNVASVVGCVVVGVLTDWGWHITTILLFSSVGTTVSVFALWGMARSLPVLLAFCVLYGLFAGGFSSTYPGVMMAVQRKLERDEAEGTRRGRGGKVDIGMGIAFLGAGRGIGNVVCGPISDLLLGKGLGGGVGLYGSGYGGLVVFTGVSKTEETGPVNAATCLFLPSFSNDRTTPISVLSFVHLFLPPIP